MSRDAIARAEAEQRDARNARAATVGARELVAQLTRECEALHVLLADAADTLHQIATAADGNRCLRPIGEAAGECLERISEGGQDA